MEGSGIINSILSKNAEFSQSQMIYPLASSSPTSTEHDVVSLCLERKGQEIEDRYNLIIQKLNSHEKNIADLLEPVKNLAYYNTSDEESSITCILDLFRYDKENETSSFQQNISQQMTSRSSHKKVCATPKKTDHNRVAIVTPGPKMKTPSRVYRQPKDGESVISMKGSPILVTRSTFASQVPQMHIPLKDGRIYAIMGEEGLKNEVFPDVDRETLSRIKKLYEFIDEQIIKSNNSD